MIKPSFHTHFIHFPICLLLFCVLAGSQVLSQQVKGKVTNAEGNPLPYASVYIKGGSRGTTTNNNGEYMLDVPAGNMVLVCAHIGFTRQEKELNPQSGQVLVEDYILEIQQVELSEVIVQAGAEDPAIAIMRKAIERRKIHLNEIDEYHAMVYIKGLIKTTKVPKAIMGVKFNPNRDVIDSTGKGVLYFSESVTRYSKKKSGAYKEEVVSAKLSGNSQGFGFNSAKDMDVNFYENNITLQGLNSRGFISPVHDNAFNFYQFKFAGSYYEDGVEINKISVSARREYEPLFTRGFINIIEGSWRIHSIDLWLTKTSQIEIVDSMRIIQQMLPLERKYWLPQYTRLVADFGLFGFQANADFVSVFSDYGLKPQPASFWKGNVVKTIDTSANKRTVEFWSNLRPVPLTQEEELDYIKKDSLEQKLKDPKYLDSLDRISNKFKPLRFLLNGQSFIDRKKKKSVAIPGFLNSVQYNTVEQWVFDFNPVYRKWADTGAYTFSPRLRYGFGNKHLNMDASLSLRVGNNYNKRWNLTFAGGKQVFQINQGSPILPFNNSFATLVYTANYLKIYEKAYGSIAARKNYANGLTMTFRASFEDRIPLENTDTIYKWRQHKDRRFTANYPEELPPGFFDRHQALLTSVSFRFQPGQKFVQYPTRLVSLGSDAPVFSLTLTKAWAGILGSDAEFGKWVARVNDEIGMRLAGGLKYDFAVGGFSQNKNVQLPDWQHFNGNQTIVASPYVRSFQLAPYYANSTRDRFFTTAHLEWHLNGFLTNKIPFVRKANLGLVMGSNAFFVDKDRNFIEGFIGIENILKTFRIDYVWAREGITGKMISGIVIGFSGLLTGEGVD